MKKHEPSRHKGGMESLPRHAPKSPGMPKYLWLQNTLLEKIKSGNYKAGDVFCTEKELIAQYCLSISTITRALRELEEQGYIWRKQGAGTLIKDLNPSSTGSISTVERTTLFACDIAVTPMPDLQDINWFTAHELLRGIIDTFDGRVNLVEQVNLFTKLDPLHSRKSAVIISNPSARVLGELQSRQIPFCIIDRSKTASITSRPNTVNLDRMRGIYEGMAYLISELGHRDIAFIGSTREDFHHDRTAGYQIALHSFNIPYRSELEVKCENGLPENGAAAIRDLLKRKVHFTAVFVDTDLKAAGAVKELQKSGLRVPEDISVLGFDDVPGGWGAEPPLTTIRVPHFEIGVAAVKLLEKRIRTGQDVQGETLCTTLIRRQSCAGAKTVS